VAGALSTLFVLINSVVIIVTPESYLLGLEKALAFCESHGYEWVNIIAFLFWLFISGSMFSAMIIWILQLRKLWS